MKKWKHLTIEQRKVISSGIAHGYKVKNIGEFLGVDPTTVSKEVKRNKKQITIGLTNTCKKIKRWPHVCSGCSKRYNNNCSLTKYKYDATSAQKKADTNLINSRRGIDITKEEFDNLDDLIKTGVDNNKSIYQIKIENNDVIKKSTTTLYRYINNGYLTTKRMDLPYAVKYKKRKYKKKYDYSDNFIDRSNHTYLDYLAFKRKNPGVYVWQLDFLGAIKTDNNNILTFILPDLQCLLLSDVVN